MVHEILVDIQQIDDGQALIAEILRQGLIDVAVALWVKRSDVGYWSFYIGSASLATIKIGDAFHAVYLAQHRIGRSSIGLSDVRLVPPTNPVAAKAIKIRDRHRANLPTRIRARMLGDLPIEEAYIYPRTMGPMSRDEVVQTVAALMSRTGAFAPSSITLRDGSSLQAVPTSIQLGVPGELRIVLHDLEGNTDRTISADEVVSIH